MRGCNMYCAIWKGPTCQSFINIDAKETNELDDIWTFDKLPGVNLDDTAWLATSVAIFADYISPPGRFDWESYSVVCTNNKDREDEESHELDDTVTIPDWARDGVSGAGIYRCG